MSQQMRNGYGFDFPVPVGQSMLVSSITGTYTATIVAGPGKGTALATDSTGGGTYGPYSGGVVIRLQAGANSLIDYDIAVSPVLTYAGPLNAGYNSSGDVASAVDGAGISFLRGALVSGVWVTVPSIFRLRITGTGTMQMDSRDSLGDITLAAFPLTTYSGETNKIEFPYAGDNAVAIRVTLTGTVTCEVI